MDGSEIVDLRIKQISDEMLQLRQMKKRAELDVPQDMGRESKAKEIIVLISAEDLDLTEYSDTLVYRVIERPYSPKKRSAFYRAQPLPDKWDKREAFAKAHRNLLQDFGKPLCLRGEECFS